jgi:hypothetical protein
VPTSKEIEFLIREFGNAQTASLYCARISNNNGPLASWYAVAADRLRAIANGPMV